ncbi:MAG: flavin-dependent monooxygenase [Planctomycetia bacterium]|nr:flavin-dependent monooxygenase [Planctomycetia bacterium]
MHAVSLNAESDEVDGAGLIRRACDLEPVLRARATETERNRQISDETIADFRRAKITRALQPPHFGGIATDFGVAARVAEALARGCPSSSWVYCNYILLQWHVGLFEVQAQEDVWGTHDEALVAAGYMPVGVGVRTLHGFRLSGTWRYVSGIDNSEWCLFGGRVVDADGGNAEQGFFLLPREDYRIIDDWRAVGLTGTGSHSVTVDNVIVPRHRFLGLAACNSCAAPGLSLNTHPIFRAPLYAIFSYFLSGVALGAAQGAINDFIAEVRIRKTVGGVTGKQTPLAHLATVQIALAEAEAMVDAGRTLIHRDCDNVMGLLMSGRALTLDQRIDNRRSVGFGVRMAREAVDSLFDVVGAAGLLNHHPIQRHWRDVHAVAHHLSLNWNQIATLVGGYRLGQEPIGMF